MSVDGPNTSDIVKEEITPKRNAARSAKGKVTKYGEDDDDNDNEDESIIRGMDVDEDEESDYMGSDSETEKKLKKANAKPKQPRKPKAIATTPVKKSPAKKSAANVLVESQQNGDEPSTKAKADKPKKPRVCESIHEEFLVKQIFLQAKKEPATTPKKEPAKKEPKKAAKRPKVDVSR